MYIHDVVPIAILSPFALANQTTVPDVRTDEGKSQEEESSKTDYVENRLASALSFPPPCVHNYTSPSTTMGVIQTSESPTYE